MKFIVLLHAEEGAWSPDEHSVAIQESVAVCHRLAAKGQYVHAAPLQPAARSVCVRVRDGRSDVSDGPFSETKEQLGGYFVIDVPTLEDAIAVAATIPGARRGTAEIRPLVEMDGMPISP